METVVTEAEEAGTSTLVLPIPMIAQQTIPRVILPLVHRPMIEAVMDPLLVEEEEVVAEDVVIDNHCRLEGSGGAFCTLLNQDEVN